MRRLAVALALLALLAGKAFSDDWYLTYVASRLGGLDDGEARVVASASRAVDDSPALTRLLARANAIKGEPARLLEVLPRWHATSGDLARRRDELAQRAVSGNDLVALGQLAHFVTDARSREGRGLSFLGPLVGARQPELVSDPARAEQAAADTLEAVRAFAEKTGRKGAASPDAAKLLKLSVEALARARSEGLDDAATEKLLDQALEEGKAGFAVAPSRERLRYAFDAKGDVRSIDLAKDLPPLALATDDAATRALQGALADAAAAGSLPVPTARDLLETYRALEGIHLGATLVEQIDARLAQLRGRTEGLDAKVAATKRELASVDEEIAAAQKRYDKLTKLDEGPCACGAPTHRQCKTPDACEKVEGPQAAREKELLDKAKVRRAGALEAVDAAGAEQKALAAEIKAWTARAAALAAETHRELPEELKKRVAYGATLTPTIRGAIGKLLPFLPPGATISSGYRSQEKQLALILELAARHGVPFDAGAKVGDRDSWLATWRGLLDKGLVVNPPVSAQRADGSWVPPSPHEKGTCFDVAGASFAEVSAALARARRQGLVAVLKEEPRNHCVHVQVLE